MNGARPVARDAARDIRTPGDLKAHPAFETILDRAADHLVSTYDGNRLLNRVLNDRGRVVFCFLVLYLDAQSGTDGAGLTVGRMVALCQETGVCSRGRARAMIALMRWGGYLEPATGSADRRIKPLVPTSQMRDAFRQRWVAQYRMLEAVDPIVAAVIAGLEDPVFFRRLAHAIGAQFRAGYRLLHGTPDLVAAADRDGGVLVFVVLFVVARQGGDPPRLADLARRFHISRAQVLQIVKEGEASGLLVRGAEASLGALTPRGMAAMTDFFAHVLWFFLAIARQVVDGPDGVTGSPVSPLLSRPERG